VATYLPDDLLTKVDRMSMAHALEVRSPFLDYRVQEFAASLPARYKLRRGRAKWCLKELARRRGLPTDLVHRRKQGFGIPVGEWFRGELRGWLEDILLDRQTTQRGYFREREVASLLEEHLSGQIDHTPRLWTLAMLELWHRTALS
jgi:asparagine synthase (glutamine-hydrolysing)